MICLVPISRFRVRFDVAAGRPFSQLERMVLRAIKEGVTDLERMQTTFHVHPRILIEALVTLTQAGWVSFSSQEGGGFLLTSEGATATDEGQSPSTTTVTSKTSFLLLERLTGSIIGNDEVRFKSRSQLETVWDDAIRLRADVHENSLDEGQVRQLLPRRQGEWVRWIGPIDMMSKGAHWVPVGVDIAAGTLVGLPDRWRTRLGPTILDEAKKREATVPASARAKQWTVAGDSGGTARLDDDARSGGTWPTDLAAGDLLFDGKDHDTLLTSALTEATSSVFIASAFLGTAAVEHLRESMLGALRRGVNLDLLWGYAAGADAGDLVLEGLKKLAYEARRDGHPGELRFNRDASGSHAKLLIYDAPAGISAVVGSYNWLSAFGGPTGTVNVSIRLRNEGVVAEACACAAALWTGARSETLSSTADRWRSIAADLDKQAAKVDGQQTATDAESEKATVRLVFDREHETILREWSATAQQRLLILSHRLGPAAESRLVRTDESSASLFVVAYGLTELDEDWLSKIEGMVAKANGTITKRPQIHAKVVVSDTSVCISSYNFLSADPFGTARRTRELGVVVEGGDVAATVVERLRQIIG